ncbi:MAG: eukaryotic-like serine/threonine-protein kinase [Verrucomicrobiota bacterium]|jgi:serine/threonine protein kinase
MEAKTYFEHYRVCTKEDGSPWELSKIGDTIAYKAVDVRSGEPRALRLIPVASVDPAIREQFEEQSRALEALDHVNIARVYAFAIEDDHYVFLSEFLHGQTIESWVRTHGGMPPDAVLRVALQGTSALGAASFHRLTHRAIQPSNLMIVPGQVIEGGWPFVKLTNFSVAGLRFDLENDANLSASPQFASPEQLQHGTIDFRSEIYSLGATMCFMLSGMALSASGLRKQIRRFPKAMRPLLAHLLRENPDERPQDPVLLATEIRDALQKIDRRQMLAQKLGIALPPSVRRFEQPASSRRFSRKALAVAAVLLALGIAASAMFSENVRRLMHVGGANDAIGVPVGVTETGRAPFVQSVSRVGPTSAATNAPVKQSIAAPSPQTNPTIAQAAPSIPAPVPAAVSTPAPPVIANAPNVSAPAPSVPNNPMPVEPPPPAQGPSDISQGNSVAQSNVESPASRNDQSSSTAKEQTDSSGNSDSSTVSRSKAAPPAATSDRTSTLRRARVADALPNESEAPPPRFPPGTVRLKFVGMTPDGRVKLRMPSGRVVIVTPRGDDNAATPRRSRRGLTERREIYPPPSDTPVFPSDE